MAALTWSLPATQHHAHHQRVQSSPPAISMREASGTNPAVVASYYDRKTASILKKYGPGPRVHFHLGYFEEPLDTAVEADVLRQRIRRAQEDVVERAARAWDAPREFAGRLLDVGCGLGGGAIYWAQHCPTDVTAVTIAREHL